MKLSEAQEEQSYRIESLQGDEHFEARISAMGLRAGVSLTILRNRRKSPLLIYARDTMIAIGRNESEKILVGGMQNGKYLRLLLQYALCQRTGSYLKRSTFRQLDGKDRVLLHRGCTDCFLHCLPCWVVDLVNL